MPCTLDKRWYGEHGIGRFAQEISKRLNVKQYMGHGKPMSPIDSLMLAYQLSKNSKINNWFLSPGYNGPLWGKTPYVLTIHDLNHIDRSDNSNLAKRIYYRLVMRRLSRRARAVLTVSEFSRLRLISWMGLDPTRVFNVGNGVSDVFCSEGERWSCGFDYVLSVSNRRGHKNERAVVAAFAVASLPISVRLVFTGHETKELVNYAKSVGVSDRLIFTGRVTEGTLASLYRGATCLCFASLYEGFGLPIIEAFASGTPVITSNITSMPEIAGDAALLIDPNNIASIAKALSNLYADSELRGQLVQRGYARVKKFTWDGVADRVKAAISAVDDDPERRLDWN